ncbi:MAG: NAD(P)H-dependent oxidoreductase [Flavobacteriales bacterium]
MERLAGDRASFSRYPSIADLPHFNPDFDVEPGLAAVKHFRDLLANTEGLLICTPEYAMGVPGSLKNDLDRTVSSADLRLKPTLLVTASLSGEKAQASLLGILLVHEAVIRSFTLSLRHLLKERDIEVIEIIPPALNTDLGGKGLHDKAPPVSAFLDPIFPQLEAGRDEVAFAFSEERLNAWPELYKTSFARLNP